MRWILNIGSNYLKTIVGMVVVFLLMPFTIHMIGKEMFGLWSLIFSVVGLFGLMDFGFATAAVKYVAERTGAGDTEGRNSILSTLLVIYTCIGVVCLVLVAIVAGPASGFFAISGSQSKIFSEIVWLLGMVIAISFPAGLFKAALIGSGQMNVVNGLELLQLLVNTSLIVWLLSAGYGVRGLAISTATSMLLTSFLLIPAAYRMVPDFHLSWRQFSKERIPELLSFSIYAFIANIAMLLILRIDPVVISMFLPLTAVATYAVAVKVSEYTYLLNKQFSNALMPLVSQSHGKGDKDTVRRVLIDGTRFQMAVALPFIALLYYYAPSIITLWVGHEFDDSVPLLRILLVAVFFSATQLNVANVLGMTGYHRFVAFSMAGSAAINLLLSIVLVQYIGLYGVALATLVAAFSIEMLIIIPRACRTQELSLSAFFMQGIFPSFPAAVPMLATAWLLGALFPADSILIITLEGAVAALVYLVVFVVSGVHEVERLAVMRKFKKRVSAHPPGGV